MVNAIGIGAFDALMSLSVDYLYKCAIFDWRIANVDTVDVFTHLLSLREETLTNFEFKKIGNSK